MEKVNGQPHVLADLPPGNKFPVLINRRLSGSQSKSGCFREEKNLLPLARI
jgi:hypothetical protein